MFCKFHRKAPVLESLFKKVAGLKAYSFIKKETPAKVFSCKFYEIFKDTFFYRTPPVAASEEMISSVKQFNRDTAQTIKCTFSISYNCPA